MQEAQVMKSYNATYIVQLLGVVSDGQPALIVMEYMAKGNLRDYLRFTRVECPQVHIQTQVTSTKW